MISLFRNTVHLMWTDPAEDMLLGFAMQRSYMEELDGTPIGSMDVFSIGLFIGRIDIYFNVNMDE